MPQGNVVVLYQRHPGGGGPDDTLSMPIGSIDLGSPVWAVAMSSDMQMIAAGCDDGKVYIVSAATGKATVVLEGHAK